MTKENNNKRSSKQRGSILSQFMVLMVTFFLGYLAACFFDSAALSNWVNAQLAHHQEQKPDIPVKQAQPAVAAKPKFEFYTLLANEKVAGSAQTGANANANAAVGRAVEASVAASNNQVHTAQNASNPAAAINPHPPVELSAKVVERRLQERVTSARGGFAVQVASFKARRDAEHMKGMLTLKGFHVSVVPVTQAQGIWYRVVVGPYANRNLAQKAQFSLDRNERIRGMVVRTST